MESWDQTRERSQVDIALCYLMIDGLLRRSEAAVLTWEDKVLWVGPDTMAALSAIRRESDIDSDPVFDCPTRQELWRAYNRQGGLLHAPPNDFEIVRSRGRAFLRPVYASILADETFDLHWPAAGPWQAHTNGG